MSRRITLAVALAGCGWARVVGAQPSPEAVADRL